MRFDAPDSDLLDQVVDACRLPIEQRFHNDNLAGAAAMLMADGTVLTVTSPHAINPSVEVCHEIEPCCAAFRLDQPIVASVCLHCEPGGRVLILSPCGVCRERLAVHGPDVQVGVADLRDATVVVWKTLKNVLPNYWMTAFPDEVDKSWLS